MTTDIEPCHPHYTEAPLRAFQRLRSPDLPRRYTLPFIASETKIPLNWLKRFSADKCKRPDASTIETLNKYLEQIF